MRLLIAGGVLLATGAVFAGFSFARGEAQGAQGGGQAVAWTFPLPPARGPGFSSLDSAAPNGAWPALPPKLRGPEQPVFYRHDVHAGQYRMPCLYCHNNAANSYTANIPAVSVCLGCHQLIQAADSAGNPNPDIVRLRGYADSTRSIPWVRVFKISEHAHFPHMRHVNARIACQECHGNIQQMARVFAVRDVNQMGWCTGCHMQRGVTRDCTICHY